MVNKKNTTKIKNEEIKIEDPNKKTNLVNDKNNNEEKLVYEEKITLKNSQEEELLKEIEKKKAELFIPKPVKSGLFITLSIIIFLILIATLISGCTSLIMYGEEDYGNVAMIPIEGTISFSSGNDFMSDNSDANYIIEQIKTANEDENILAIILNINSGGGSPVASAEIAQAVKNSKKPVVAWIRETGASGAYWVASSSDYIIAHELSITGSIGVIGSYLEFDDFLADHNISYNRQVAGQYKDMASPLKDMTSSEEILFSNLLQDMHEIFIRNVAENRNMSYDAVKKLADGRIYLGITAKENGLIDAVGTSDDVHKYLKELIKEDVDFKYYYQQKSFLDSVMGMNSNLGKNIGLGIGESLSVAKETNVRV
jgi:protease IV